jgi:hypothetical protein
MDAFAALLDEPLPEMLQSMLAPLESVEAEPEDIAAEVPAPVEAQPAMAHGEGFAPANLFRRDRKGKGPARG